ncbi:hypothetical protein NDU88_003483 [Pleurodeles waltl]|uniref:Uncharacterized protein n=1 Tax=Pleurodeles waltl TaxID=8319 RepID=A0AAV7KY90_PLEWA|nr:hypothetical protein NDU88_003483 [Pleurodeles waltl]
MRVGGSSFCVAYSAANFALTQPHNGLGETVRRLLRASRRLSDNAAPDAAESRTVFRSCGRDDDSPSYQSNGDAGNHLGNPDIRVPKSTEKDDGLCAEEGKNADNEKERSEETEDGSRNGNSEVSLKIDGQPWAGKRVETCELHHVPGGAWLTKVRSFIKDSFFKKGESDGRRGGIVRGEGREKSGEGRKEKGRTKVKRVLKT